MKYYAIKRPDGSWVMRMAEKERTAWELAAYAEVPLFNLAISMRRTEWPADAESAGYRCVEVSGFVEVQDGRP